MPRIQTVYDADHGGNVLSKIFGVLLSSVEGIDPNGNTVRVEVLIGSQNSVDLEKSLFAYPYFAVLPLGCGSKELEQRPNRARQCALQRRRERWGSTW